MFVGGNNAGKSTVVKGIILLLDFLQYKKVSSSESPRFRFDGPGSHDVNIDTFNRALCLYAEEKEKWDDSRINEKKKILAYELTSLVHGKEEAEKAAEAAAALFAGNGGDDANMPTTTVTSSDLTDGAIGILDALVKTGIAKSKGDARTLVKQGGITVDGNKVETQDFKFTEEMLKNGAKIKKGKKIFHKIILG